jgi:hypothetical protein
MPQSAALLYNYCNVLHLVRFPFVANSLEILKEAFFFLILVKASASE